MKDPRTFWGWYYILQCSITGITQALVTIFKGSGYIDWEIIGFVVLNIKYDIRDVQTSVVKSTKVPKCLKH